MTTTALRRVATYERVSSEDQRERETIKTQQNELALRLEESSGVSLVKRYIDDGVSGTLPMILRPSGKRLMADAGRDIFDEVWVWRLDRLGRDDVDPLVVRRDLERLGVKVLSATEDISDPFIFHIHVAIAAQERRNFLARSSAGMNRAAREGRYTGGIVPMGYQVEGRKQTARLVPSDKLIWGEWTEANLVQKIYHWMAIDGWTCPRISRHLNALRVPTAYTRDERLVRRGERKERTQGCWRPGRLLSMITNPVYKGQLQYGRRCTKPGGREVISASITPLVSEDVWDAAQQTLKQNQIIPKNSGRIYLLRSVIRCGGCGKTYVGSWGRGLVRYRCNGRMIDRRPIDDRCQSKSLKGPDIEPLVWGDIERFLRNPGDILEELDREREMESDSAIAEAERLSMEAGLEELKQRRKKAIDLNLRGRISDEELDDLMAEVTQEQGAVEKRLLELQPELSEPEEAPAPELLEELRLRLDEGLTDTQRQEIVRLLVKCIIVKTEANPESQGVKVLIEYRFPGAVNVNTGRGSGQPPA